MWIVKGVSLGIGIFLLATLIYILAMIEMSPASVVGLKVIEGWTIRNPVYWGVLGLFIVAGCSVARWKARENKIAQWSRRSGEEKED